MWWQDVVTVVAVVLAAISLVTAMVSALLVVDPATAAHCSGCDRWMIDTRPHGAPVCMHCRHGHRPAAERVEPAAAGRHLTGAARPT